MGFLRRLFGGEPDKPETEDVPVGQYDEYDSPDRGEITYNRERDSHGNRYDSHHHHDDDHDDDDDNDDDGGDDGGDSD